MCASHSTQSTRIESFNASKLPTGDVASKRPACPCLQDSPCPEAALFGHVCRSGSTRGAHWSLKQVLARPMQSSKCCRRINVTSGKVQFAYVPSVFILCVRVIPLSPPGMKVSTRLGHEEGA